MKMEEKGDCQAFGPRQDTEGNIRNTANVRQPLDRIMYFSIATPLALQSSAVIYSNINLKGQGPPRVSSVSSQVRGQILFCFSRMIST